MDQRAAAALALRHHDLDAEPGQQPDRRLVDAGIEHRWAQPVSMRDAAARARLGGDGRPGRDVGDRGGTVAGASVSIAASGFSAGTPVEQRREGPAEPRQPQRQRGTAPG